MHLDFCAIGEVTSRFSDSMQNSLLGTLYNVMLLSSVVRNALNDTDKIYSLEVSSKFFINVNICSFLFS